MTRQRALLMAAVLVFGLTLVPGIRSTAQAASVDSPAVVRVAAADDGERHTHAAALVAQMTPRQKAATVVMGHHPSTDPAAVAEYMRATGLGGFILMGANIPGSPAALREVTAALAVDESLRPLVAVDQEGGDVSRLRWDDFPSALTLKDAPVDQVALAFLGRGALLESAGIGVNFGIVADWTDDRGSFIYRRVLGTTADGAAARVAAAVAGEKPFAASTLKHFPGHGAAPGDSHRIIPTTDRSLDQWLSSEALPFAAGIDAGADLVMFGHLAYTEVDPLPASLSSTWHGILRDELGFTGIAVTDDMAMLEASGRTDPVANAIDAIIAGNDLILGVGYSTASRANAVVDGIAAAVVDGRITAQRIDEAATRVVALRLVQGTAALACDACAPAT